MATKPIMEKRRRARINQCLTELKGLILDALNKDPSRHSKLEKADILEMTVRHLQNVQRQQMAAAISTDHTVLNKFRAGFGECANEVSRYVSRIEGVEHGIRQRLVNYLSNCVSSLNAATPFSPPASSGAPGAAGMAFPGMTPPFQGLVSPLHVQIPAGLTMPTIGFVPASAASNANQPGGISMVNDINNNTNGNKIITAGGLPLLPSRLPNGDLAFLLPSQALSSSSGHFPLGIPVLSSSSEVPSTSGSFGQSRSTSLSSWGQETATPLTPTSPLSAGSPSPASSVGSGLSLSGSDAGSEMSAENSATPTTPSVRKHEVPSPPSSLAVRTPTSPKKSVSFADHFTGPDSNNPHHPSHRVSSAEPSSQPPTFHPTSVIQRPTGSSTSSSSDLPAVTEPHKPESDNVWRPW